jgi:hypothetical protein
VTNDELITNVSQKLEECEAVIERGIRTFIEVGSALATIRDNHLYKADGYYSFHDYLKARWDLSVSRAYQMIDASRVTRELSTIVETPELLPATESQARELVGLDAQQAAQVMAETAARVRGKVTAKKIRETRERITNPPQQKPKPPKPQPTPTVERDVNDEHYYCDDETWWKQEALAAWDENPDAFTLAPRFRDLLDRHPCCCDWYIMAGQWAGWLDFERHAPGGDVLAALALEICDNEKGLRHYVQIREMLGRGFGGDDQ